MASRTRLVCLCEGGKGQSVDEVFINRLLKSLNPGWLRRAGSNVVRLVPCGGRKSLIERMPAELRTCITTGADTTLMVWADCDDTCTDGDALREVFWTEALRRGVSKQDFDRVVFVFAKDRLENWIEFLLGGSTDEAKEGPRVKHNRDAAEAARKLAAMCKAGRQISLPPSLQWSCMNWRALVERMKPA